MGDGLASGSAEAGEGKASSDEARELTVMRAIVHHNLCAIREHLHQYDPALAQARQARRIAQAVLPPTNPLFERLRAVEHSVDKAIRAKSARQQKILAQGKSF